MDMQHENTELVEVRPIRIKESRKKARKRRSLTVDDVFGVSAVICAVSAIALFVWPQTGSAFDDVAGVLGAVLLSTTVILGTVYTRNRYRNNPSRWESAGCPQCSNTDLKRMRRKRRHRIAGTLTHIPIRRYICPECSWRGTRIDESRLY